MADEDCASGFSHFKEHEILHMPGRGYLKNDTLEIRAIVRLNALANMGPIKEPSHQAVKLAGAPRVRELVIPGLRVKLFCCCRLCEARKKQTDTLLPCSTLARATMLALKQNTAMHRMQIMRTSVLLQHACVTLSAGTHLCMSHGHAA